MNTILVLDDDRSFRQLAQEVFEDEGAQVITTETVADALEALRGGGVDALLTDWNLDPTARRGGPYSEPVVREALALGLPVKIMSGTDDSTEKLRKLQDEFREAALSFVSKESLLSALAGWPPERR